MQDIETQASRPRATSEISLGNRIIAVLIANLAAALVYQAWDFTELVGTGRGTTAGFSSEASLRMFALMLCFFLMLSAVPTFALITMILRKFFPTLLLASLTGALTGFIVVTCGALLMAMIFHWPAISGVAAVARRLLLFAVPAGAAGGAAAWCYLALVRKRQAA